MQEHQLHIRYLTNKPLNSIVAVHDVHQDSLDTWTHQTSGINWLRDLLPQDVRVGRILSYGYDSSASTLLADDGPETIQRMAESFVQELRADRQFAGTLRRSALLVDHQSAAPKLDNTETAGIHAAHPDMCKFGSRASSDYRTVIAALVTYCEKAPGIISRRWRQAEGALKQLRLGEVEEIGGFGFDVHLEQPYRSQDIRSQGDLIHFHIPEETSPTFVGREDLLRTLRSAFFPGDGPTTRPGRKSFVIFGMGGSGKTELCSKFATDNKLE